MGKHSHSHKCDKQGHYIGHYEEAPNYMKDNEHITHGYRIGFDTPRKIFRSLFQVHNQSVNVWSHLVPAIIMLCLLVYFLVCVGPVSIMTDLNAGKERLNRDIAFYSEALSNLSFVVQMKEIQAETTREMEEMKQSLLNSYGKFEHELQNWKAEAKTKFDDLQTQVSQSWHHQLKQLEMLKQDFQKIFVPYVVNEIKDKIDTEYINSLAERLKRIKEQLDSPTYDYIESNMYQPNPHAVSRWPVFVFLCSAVICLLCSATFHLFYPMSGSKLYPIIEAYQVFSRLDYAGINVLIAGSSFPALYYGMYCNFNLVIFYLTIICLLGLSLFIASLFEYLHRPEHLTLKSLAYGGFGVSLSIPLAHAVINQVLYNNYGDAFSMKQSIWYYILCGFFYLFGLYIYTVRCPERHRPGKFNTCGNSHQIWHMFVVLGILATFGGAITNLETRKLFACPA